MTDGPLKRLADAYAHPNHDTPATVAARAAAHRPELDEQIERMSALEHIDPNQRLQIGYHDSAREAAQRLKNEEK